MGAEGIQSKGSGLDCRVMGTCPVPSPCSNGWKPPHVPVNADAEVRIGLVAGDVRYTAFLPRPCCSQTRRAREYSLGSECAQRAQPQSGISTGQKVLGRDERAPWRPTWKLPNQTGDGMSVGVCHGSGIPLAQGSMCGAGRGCPWNYSGGLLMETTQSGICLLLQLPEPDVEFLDPGTQIPVPVFTQETGPQVPLSRAQFP